jgi:hypothetical protein
LLKAARTTGRLFLLGTTAELSIALEVFKLKNKWPLSLQLFACHIAVVCGCDVDKPRNLAKSVTVE